MNYSFTARDLEGKKVSASINASDTSDAMDKLESMGLTPISIVLDSPQISEKQSTQKSSTHQEELKALSSRSYGAFVTQYFWWILVGSVAIKVVAYFVAPLPPNVTVGGYFGDILRKLIVYAVVLSVVSLAVARLTKQKMRTFKVVLASLFVSACCLNLFTAVVLRRAYSEAQRAAYRFLMSSNTNASNEKIPLEDKRKSISKEADRETPKTFTKASNEKIPLEDKRTNIGKEADRETPKTFIDDTEQTSKQGQVFGTRTLSRFYFEDKGVLKDSSRPHILFQAEDTRRWISRPQCIWVGQTCRVYFSCYEATPPYLRRNNQEGIYCFKKIYGAWRGQRFPASLDGSRWKDSVHVKNEDLAYYISSRGTDDNAVMVTTLIRGKVSSVPVIFQNEIPLFPSVVDNGWSGIGFAYRDDHNQRLMFANTTLAHENMLEFERKIVDKENNAGWMCRAVTFPEIDGFAFRIGIIYGATTIRGEEVRLALGTPTAWSIMRIDEASIGRTPAIAVSPDGKKVGCIYGSPPRYAYKEQWEGRWHIETISGIDAPYYDFTYDSNGNPLVVIYGTSRGKDGWFVTKLLLALKRDNGWHCTLLDSNIEDFDISATGLMPSIAVSSTGEVAVTYLESLESGRTRVKVIILTKGEIDSLTERNPKQR